MRLLEALASAFINTFGITRPTEGTRRQSAWFILGLLMLTALVVGSVAAWLLRLLRG